MDLDDLDDPFLTPSKSSRNPSSSPRSAVSKRRIALSPTAANGKTRDLEPSNGRSRSLLIANPADRDSEDKENVQLATPQTPRHRDALSKKVPVTPRHRVILAGNGTASRVPRTPSTPGSIPTLYNDARQVFVRSAEPGRLVGRDTEREELNSFLRRGIETNSGRCLYVSGPPGTGKSALIGEVCNGFRGTENVQMAYINCMSVKSSKDIYIKLIEDLACDSVNEGKDETSTLRALFVPKKKSHNQVYVVTLDEIDHLLSLDLEILYTLFEWSLQRASRLVLIGIANALDLTDRFLPRLKARNLKPQLLPFLPYTAPQIASVLTAKLKSLHLSSDDSQPDYVPFVHPTAIQFCSKKVAAQTGDLRKAFDIMRRAIDLVETETKQKHLNELNTINLFSPSKSPLGENLNLSSPSRPKTLASSLVTLTSTTAPRATIAHIARVTSAILSNGTPQRLQTLNLQQKAALCALISLDRSNRAAARSIFATPSKSSTLKQNLAPTIRELYITYCMLCKRENALHPLTSTEFADVVSGLETLGLAGEDGRGFTLAKGRGTPSKKGGKGKEERRVVSWVGETELDGCLEGIGGDILKRFLRGDWE